MSLPIGVFDKEIAPVAWFDTTLQPSGWFSTDIVTTESEAQAGVEASAAFNEAADTSAAQVSVTAHATGVLTEVGDRAPRSLANAFLRPVPLKHDADIAALAVTRLGEHLAALDGMYGSEEDRRVASIIEGGRALAEAASLDGLAAWAGRMAGG